jgi:polar amino acid transport system substrate-binding protein
MRKLLGVSAAAAALSLLVAGCGAADPSPSSEAPAGCTSPLSASDLVTAGTLTMSTNATLPPMQFVDASGNLAGMRVDLGNEIAKDLCLKASFVNVDFDSQIPGLSGKRWDMINTGMFYTAERSKSVILVPYEVQGVAISVPQGNPKGLKAGTDLAGVGVAVEAPGYEYDTLTALSKTLVAQGKPAIDIKTFKTTADAYQALAAGQADAVAIVDSVTTYYQDNGRFETAFKGLNTAPLAFGFANAKTAGAVAGVLAQLKQNGYLDQLFGKYGVTAYSGAMKVTTGTLPA